MKKMIILALGVEGLQKKEPTILYWLAFTDHDKLEKIKAEDFDMQDFVKNLKGLNDTSLSMLAAKYHTWKDDNRDKQIELYFDMQNDSMFDRWEKDNRMITRIRSFSKIETQKFMEAIFDPFR